MIRRGVVAVLVAMLRPMLWAVTRWDDRHMRRAQRSNAVRYTTGYDEP